MSNYATDESLSDIERRHHLRASAYYGRLLSAVARSVRDADLPPGRMADAFYGGSQVVETIYEALNERSWDMSEADIKNAKTWHHENRVNLTRKAFAEPYLQLQGVASAAGAYLALPFRVPQLDRLLVDLLMAAEMFAFADQVRPQIKQLHRLMPPILAAIWSNAMSLLIGLGSAGVILWLFPSSTAAAWVAGIIGGFTVLGTAIAVVTFPFLYPRIRRERLKLQGILDGMIDSYVCLGGQPTSVAHLQSRLAKATDVGVVWPAVLIVLLEDVAARSKTI